MKTLPASLTGRNPGAGRRFPSRPPPRPPCGTENLLAGKKPSASQAVKGDVGLVTDGTVGPEGAEWNAPVTVTLENANSSITYDLGEAREISAIVLQADANDTYKVMGSVDGSPAQLQADRRAGQRRQHRPRPAHARHPGHADDRPLPARRRRQRRQLLLGLGVRGVLQGAHAVPARHEDRRRAARPRRRIRRRRPSPGRTPAAGRCC